MVLLWKRIFHLIWCKIYDLKWGQRYGVLTHHAGQSSIADGNIRIDFNESCVYQWIFEILHQNTNKLGVEHKFEGSIGIASIRWKYWHWYDGDIEHPHNVKEYEKIKTGDIIKMEVNTKDKTLTFYHNNSEPHTTIIQNRYIQDQNSTTYRLIVRMFKIGAIKLKSFNQTLLKIDF